MARYFIVVNPSGLNVRSKPDTATGQVVRHMTNGEGFTANDVFTQGNQTWARVSRGEGVQQEYCCIAIANKVFCREQVTGQVDIANGQTAPGQLLTPFDRLEKLEAWARTKGYTG